MAPGVPLQIDGNWFNHNTSKPVPARLIMARSDSPVAMLKFEDGRSIAVEIKKASDRLGGVDRQLTLSNNSTFVTSDNDSVDKISALNAGLFSRVHTLEAFRPRLLGFLVAVIGLMYGLYTYGLPAAARFAAWATPTEVVAIMESSTLSTLDRIALGKSSVDTGKQERFQAAFTTMVNASGDDARFKLLIRDGGFIGPNAFALPGGTIVVTDQLVNLATEDEVVAVLGHEIAHVTHDHSLQQLYRGIGFAGLISVFAGDVGLLAEEVLGGGGLLVAMAASREMELEADAEALPLLRAVDVKPENLITLLDKLYDAMCKGQSRETCEETGWFASHPGGEERRKALRKAIAAQ